MQAPPRSTAQPVRPERNYLLVIDGQVSYPFDLPTHGEVVIGRAPDAAIRLDDTSASRHHARLDLSNGDAARVADLGSRNGTRVNGEPVNTPTELLSGDVIAICSSTLIFHRESTAPTERSALNTAQLRQRLLEETDRSLHFHRPVSLLCLNFSGSVPSRPAILDALLGQLRVSDAVSWAGHANLLVLLPERDAAAAASQAERLALALASLGSELRIGTVSCPRDGSDPDALLWPASHQRWPLRVLGP